jgi:GNAT superfamily N-acetyltransferase
MRMSVRVRNGSAKDIFTIERLLVDWLDWKIPRQESIKRAVKNKEILVAEKQGKVVGFIHYVIHEDIIDGGPNAFITAFYVLPDSRRSGVGSSLLGATILRAFERGAVGVEASTANPEARQLYEKHHFKQFTGKDTMGEIFLELDIEEYKRAYASSPQAPRRTEK